MKKRAIASIGFALPFICFVSITELTPLIVSLILGFILSPYFLSEPLTRKRQWIGSALLSFGIAFAYGIKIFYEDPTTYFGASIILIIGFSYGILGTPAAYVWSLLLQRLSQRLDG